MTAICLMFLKMSYTASFVIIAICVMRLILKKAPRKYSYWLWSIVGFRLCCPITWKSPFNLFYVEIPAMIGSEAGGTMLNGEMAENIAFQLANTSGLSSYSSDFPVILPAGFAQILPFLQKSGAILWLAGVTFLLGYTVIRFMILRRQLETAVLLEDSIYQSERIGSPFVFGIFRPRIYIPYGMDEQTMYYVLAHERYHIKRKDYLMKGIALLLLCLHWYNPLCWLAFHLMHRDMEMSCDEYVLSTNSAHSAKAYSTAILSVAGRGYHFPGALAFGETDVRKRIQNILRWKPQKRWVLVFAGILCCAMILFCGADPVSAGDIQTTRKPLSTNQETVPDRICPDCKKGVMHADPVAWGGWVKSEEKCIHYNYNTDIVWTRQGVQTVRCTSCNRGYATVVFEKSVECHGVDQ